MKKATWLISTVAAALLASGAPLTIKAAGPGEAKDNLNTSTNAAFVLKDDTDTAEANSVALFSIKAGKLSLKSVPNLNFGPKDVQDLIKGDATLTLADGKVAPGTDGYDGNDAKTIQVEDFRGNNVGWKLTASLGEFMHGSEPLTATSLVFDGSAQGDNYLGVLGTGDIAKGAVPIINAGQGEGSGVTNGIVRDATLILPQTYNASAGEYRAKITWLLATTPPEETPTDLSGNSGADDPEGD
ncbi:MULTISPECIES: WxL domain-containing protein [unclassified Lacticaseibacillus]|uniref:WxL domain-containing protein n=1 Tax=unclassified Lacticaseibacillus TaxID=2759744 RepID=UPI00194459F1|nr:MULTISPECIES: WxL domain-containing protein [unclassified Lacticaseibacillus]